MQCETMYTYICKKNNNDKKIIAGSSRFNKDNIFQQLNKVIF